MIGDAWNIPNSLTLLRILLIPVFVGLMLYDRYEPALAVLLGEGGDCLPTFKSQKKVQFMKSLSRDILGKVLRVELRTMY